LLLPGLIKAMFAPASVPDRFDREFPKELMLRPSQLRASAEDAAMMTPVTIELQEHYRELKLPVVIVTGADDQIADVGRQSERLHGEIVNSEFIVVPGMGHMIHHLAPEQVVRAVELASKHARAAAA
ncbi:alpha/beta fold hydrolase, partial [Methylobacterium oxalidis]|uniref:alpha/beta fold hydrolase n=1 Tax=Methylobacterium oxalidis TaxID=944322 RepID=UPI003315C20E